MTRIIKFGGSVITRDDPNDSFDFENTSRLSKEIMPLTSGTVLVHGTGHVGKPFAVEHEYVEDGLIAAEQTLLIAEIRNALLRLNADVVATLCSNGVPAFSVSPATFFDEDMKEFRHASLVTELRQQMQLGHVPVFYGDLMPRSDGVFQVFSSDRITAILSRRIKPDRVVFLTDVAGVFAKNRKGEKARNPMRELSSGNLDDVFHSAGDQSDVSGGMQAKITNALEVASHAGECLIANGQKKGALAAILAGQPVECTRVVAGLQ